MSGRNSCFFSYDLVDGKKGKGNVSRSSLIHRQGVRYVQRRSLPEKFGLARKLTENRQHICLTHL